MTDEDCNKTNWRYCPLKPSAETFNLMKRCSHQYPWKPQKRRFGGQETGPFFYHYQEVGLKSEAIKVAKKWRVLGFNARMTFTQERDTWGARHTRLSSSRQWHVWVGEKKR